MLPLDVFVPVADVYDQLPVPLEKVATPCLALGSLPIKLIVHAPTDGMYRPIS